MLMIEHRVKKQQRKLQTQSELNHVKKEKKLH